MSVRSNGSGDNLLAASSWGVTTGAFSIGFWAKLIADRNTFSDLVGFGDTASGPASYLSIATQTDGSSLTSYDHTAGELFAGNPAELTVGTWYWVVVSRTGSDMALRVFDDSTSTTPVQSDTESAATDYAALDNFVVGQLFSGEWSDAEFQNVKVHNGVEWTDAQCRTESQNYEIQTAGGTKWASYRLIDVDADSDGINDGSGNGRHLTNTGFVAGASTPAQLASGTNPVGTDTATLSDAPTAGGFTASVAGAES